MVKARFMRPHCFPSRVCGFPLPVLCCSVFRVKPCHPMVESARGSVQYVLTSACLLVPVWMCVFPGFFFFFFRWCRINCGSHMCVETAWGLVVSCPPTLDFLLLPLVHLIIFPLPFPTAAPVLLYHPFFVYSIEDVWLNILRPAESSWFSNFSCPVCQRKTKACAKYIWMRSLNLSELTFYFSSFLVSITSSFLPLCFICVLSALNHTTSLAHV